MCRCSCIQPAWCALYINQVLWAKDGHLIPSSANHYRVGKFGSLEFSTVGLDDDLVYTCSAENEAGSANRTIELSVQGQ